MEIFKFSLNDLKLAKYIIANDGLDRFGLPLYRPSFITWANKVIRWWSRFYQVLKAYAKCMGEVGLAAKALWSNINRGLSLPFMLRKLQEPEGFNTDKGAVWQKPRFSGEETAHNGTPVTFFRTRSAKSERRTKNKHITNALQSA